MNFTNTSNTITSFQTTHKLVITTFLALIAAVGTPLNTVIVFLILADKKLRNKTFTHFLLQHTITDTIVCLLSAPLMAYRLNNAEVKAGIICKFYLPLTITCSLLVLYALAGMSFDRYLAIAKPYFYCKNVVNKSAVWAIVVIFSTAILSTIPFAVIDKAVWHSLNSGFHCSVNPRAITAWYALYLLSLRVIAILIIVVCNCIVFKIARKQLAIIKLDTKRIQSFENGNHARDNKIYPEIIKDIVRHEVNDETSETQYGTIKENILKSEPIQGIGEPIQHLDNHKSTLENKKRCELSTTFDTESDVHLVSLSNYKDNSNQENVISNKLADVTQGVSTMQNKNILSCSNSSLQKIPRNTRDKSVVAKKRNKKDYKIAVSTLLLIIVLAVSYLPFGVLKLIQFIDSSFIISKLKVLYTYTKIGNIIISAINPFVILLSRRKIRKRFRFCSLTYVSNSNMKLYLIV